MIPSKKKTTLPSSSSSANDVVTSKEASREQSYEDKKSGWCRQRFREDWCTESQFEGWLEEVPDDPFRAWCKCCQCALLVGRSELLKHNDTKKHKRAFVESQLGASSMMTALDASTRSAQNGKLIDEGLIRAELRLASFAADHNLNVTAVDHLGLLVNKLGDRLDLIPKIHLDVNKCSSIVDKVLMASVRTELETALRSNCFSLVVDEVEMNDPGRRAFAVLVRYYNANLNKIFNQLLQTFLVSDRELAHKSLWKRIHELLSKLKIPPENLTSISCDHSSPFFNDSFTDAELNEYNRDLTVFRFNGRSMFKVMSMAVYALPEGLETLMLHFGNIVTGQMKHVYPAEMLNDFPEMTNFEARKPFHNVPVKEWLLNANCNAVLAQCFPYLISLLERRALQTESVVAENLIKEATNPYTKAYFLFLSYILTHLESMNNLLTSFLSNNFQLITEFLALFKSLCQHFLAPAVIMVSDLTKVDLEDEKNFLPVKSIFIGSDCQEYLKALNAKEETEQFLGQCRRMLQVAAVEIKNRFSLNDTVLHLLPLVDPSVALCSDSRAAFPTLQPLTAKFPKLNFMKLDEQWLELPNYFSASDTEELKRLPVDKMWGVICDLRKSNDVLKFDSLGRLAKIMLSLPIPDAGMMTLLGMISQITRGFYSEAEMKLRLDVVSLRHTDLSSDVQCFQQRVTMKMRKLYMMNINKKEDFPQPKYIFESENS